MSPLPALLALALAALGAGEIRPLDDAPQPLSPADSAKRFQLPPDLRIDLVASEPLVREPSGLCWDERGRLLVCELHGYNLEGHLDVQELNRTGVLDREVRRIPANPRAQEAARAGTYGTVKLLTDDDGDGRMDRASVFADRLPPCYGICAARGGVIVACAPDIVFLADRDGDGAAEVREVLFTGFATGALERGINQPQPGLDGWIYIGRGHGGGTITGPRLKEPVRLGSTDFRIRADGSAIEPVTGSTHTLGHAFTGDGDRFTMTTSSPGLFVTPIPWRYLARNPDAAAPRAEEDAAGYARVFPVAPPHPWRVQRAGDPGFFKFYRDRYGAGDSEAGGWFTSACGPLVIQDGAWPAAFRGQYLACEPAQNLIHRAEIERTGPALRLRRAPGEESRELLASSDQWFHPIHVAHGPDGAVYIVDFYREIIEDYSAVPRYLQQQYGLVAGQDHGRIWRLRHRDALPTPPADMSTLDATALVREVASPHAWRRETARRLLVERRETGAASALSRLAREASAAAGVLGALHVLDGLGALRPEDVEAVLARHEPGMRVHALRFAERWLDARPELLERVLALTGEDDERVLLQLALTLGEAKDARVLPALGRLARERGGVKWMSHAILSSLGGRAGEMLDLLLDGGAVASAQGLLEPLCRAIGSRREASELSRGLVRIAASSDPGAQTACLHGFAAGLKGSRAPALEPAARESLAALLASAADDVRSAASAIAADADPELRQRALARAARDAADLGLPGEARVAAVARLAAAADHPAATGALLAAWPAATPKVREAILDGLFARRERLPALLEALEAGVVGPGELTAFQRLTLLEDDRAVVREHAAKLLKGPGGADDATFQRFAAALGGPRDLARGERVFVERCAPCHALRGIGFAVGPDIGAEQLRAEEAILKDILAPNDVLSAGFATYAVETTAGELLSGVLAGESATSITLRQSGGVERVILRKDISRLESAPVSLMPEALAQVLAPEDVAAVIAWLRGPESGLVARSTGRTILFDDEPDFAARLNEGGGTAALEAEDAFAGAACLAVTPPQRFSARIPGWAYRIAEKPGPGEHRYLRLAWRTRDGAGVMIELAASGAWPDARDPRRRYFAGKNTTKWAAREVSPEAPAEWRVATVDLWKDCGAFTLTGIAPTAMGGTACFDRIELLREVEPGR